MIHLFPSCLLFMKKRTFTTINIARKSDSLAINSGHNGGQRSQAVSAVRLWAAGIKIKIAGILWVQISWNLVARLNSTAMFCLTPCWFNPSIYLWIYIDPSRMLWVDPSSILQPTETNRNMREKSLRYLFSEGKMQESERGMAKCLHKDWSEECL